MEINQRVIDCLTVELAQENIGIYPEAIEGGPKAYKKRTDWMEGWNACLSALIDNECKISNWLRSLPDKELIVKLLLEEKVSLHISGDAITPFVNCSDLFYWACADAEDISLDELPALVQACGESTDGPALWTCRKRQMRPQRPYYKQFPEDEWPLFDACGPD